MAADITIFEPETVRDNATYAKETLPSTGIPCVVVNGGIVMKDSGPIKGIYIDPARGLVGVCFSTNPYVPPYGEDKMPGFLREAAKVLAGK